MNRWHTAMFPLTALAVYVLLSDCRGCASDACRKGHSVLVVAPHARHLRW